MGLSQQRDKMSSEILFKLKPKIGPAIAQAAFVAIIMGVIITIFIFMGGPEAIVSGILAAMIGIFIIIRIMNLLATEYSFYKDRVEFYEGFIGKIRRSVHYDKITDTVLTQNIFGRIFGTGNFELMTAGSVPQHRPFTFRRQNFAGILIEFIPNPEENYKKVQEIIHKK